MRASVPMTIVALATVSLAGCSSDSGSSAASASASSVRAAAAAKTTQPDGSYGARSDLTKNTCAADKAGEWSFAGTLTNSQKSEQAYVVSASIVDGKTSTVLGRKVIESRLAPGKAAELKAEKFAKNTTAGVQCVVRVTRKPA